MTEKDLSTLRIHRLTQKQYNEAVDDGRIENEAIYLTTEDQTNHGYTIVVSDTKPTADDPYVITLVYREKR